MRAIERNMIVSLMRCGACLAALLPFSVASQTAAPGVAAPAPVLQTAPAPGTVRPAVNAQGLALGAEIERLNGRLAALERLISQLVSQQDEDHRRLAVQADELTRLRANLGEQQAANLPAPTALEPQPEPAAQVLGAAPAPVANEDLFEKAMAFVRQEDWRSAELSLTTFLANNPGDDRTALARFQLGSAYLGQQQPAQAAQIFLALFESGEAAAFGADNLFALARALRSLDDIDQQQVCSVYSEIEASYWETLSPKQREDLLGLRLADACPQ